MHLNTELTLWPLTHPEEVKETIKLMRTSKTRGYDEINFEMAKWMKIKRQKVVGKNVK